MNQGVLMTKIPESNVIFSNGSSMGKSLLSLYCNGISANRIIRRLLLEVD